MRADEVKMRDGRLTMRDDDDDDDSCAQFMLHITSFNMSVGNRTGQSDRAKDRKQPVAVAVEVEIAAGSGDSLYPLFWLDLVRACWH
jgi:hypothetical protein